MVGEKTPVSKTKEQPLGLGEQLFWIALAVVIIGFPRFTIAAALVCAIYLEYFSAPNDDKIPKEETLGLLAFGVLFIFVEFMDWLLRYRDEVPFGDVLFPTDDTPADLRFIFIGWVLLFMWGLNGIRKFVAEDQKLDANP